MNNKLIVSNFHPDTTEGDLIGIFNEYGLESVVLKPGKYAVLTFKEDWGATEAKQAWGNSTWWGYWLRIKYADPLDDKARRRQRKARRDDDD